MAGPGVVVPVRAFAGGFARLAGRLGDDERTDLARRLAVRVVEAAGSRPIVVVTSAPEVHAWATDRHLDVVDDPGSLDAAAAAGRAWLSDRGYTRAVVAHADLPFVRSLDPVAGPDLDATVVVVVPDQREDGTPVLSVPVSAPFRFAYGPGSFARHIAEARQLDLEVRVVRDQELGFDVDEPEDLERLSGHLVPRAPEQ